MSNSNSVWNDFFDYIKALSGGDPPGRARRPVRSIRASDNSEFENLFISDDESDTDSTSDNDGLGFDSSDEENFVHTWDLRQGMPSEDEDEDAPEVEDAAEVEDAD
tara:strand:+ start:345 stop:662 length:318 start_codon:yes stop_codon:yes gene_type:complete